MRRRDFHLGSVDAQDLFQSRLADCDVLLVRVFHLCPPAARPCHAELFVTGDYRCRQLDLCFVYHPACLAVVACTALARAANAAKAAFGSDPVILDVLDPTRSQFDVQLQDVTIF